MHLIVNHHDHFDKSCYNAKILNDPYKLLHIQRHALRSNGIHMARWGKGRQKVPSKYFAKKNENGKN